MTATYVDRRTVSGKKVVMPAKPDDLYFEKRDVPQEWQDELQRIVPKSDELSWLWLRWEPGDVWEPVQRWCIWHMRSIQMLLAPKNGREPSDHQRRIVMELNGPHPRSTGSYDEERKMWIDGPVQIIDRGTWELYHETGYYGTRWWWVQGDNGGHRHRLDTIERKVARIMGGSADTPIPGDLPYADFDGRTVARLAMLDKLRMWKSVLDFTRRNHDQMDAEMREAEQEANRAIWNWLDGQAAKAVEKIGQVGRNTLAKSAYRQPGQSDRDFDYEKIEEDFITTPHIAA